jgi:hypothetical protein
MTEPEPAATDGAVVSIVAGRDTGRANHGDGPKDNLPHQVISWLARVLPQELPAVQPMLVELRS